MRNIYLFFTVVILLTLVSCKEKQLPKTDPELVQEITNQWSNALNNNLDTLVNLYADSVLLYGKLMGNDDVVADKENFIKKYTDFKHTIDNVFLEELEDNGYRVRFTKNVTYGVKKLQVNAQLVFQKKDDKWRIIAESDEPTERKLATEARKQEEEITRAADAQTAAFEQTVTLNGTLGTEDYSDASNNNYTVYILTLTSPLNVSAPNANYDAQTNVSQLQVGFKDEQTPDKYKGKAITVTGEIYGEETIHDRRPVVMIHGIIQK